MEAIVENQEDEIFRLVDTDCPDITIHCKGVKGPIIITFV